MTVTINDYLVVNIGGTPGTAGTGTYYVSSIGGVLQSGDGIAASADPATLTAWQGGIVWWAGEPYAWNGAGYVKLTTGGHPIDYQIAALAPTANSQGGILASGDLWWDTANNVLMGHDGAAWVSIGPSVGGYSTLVDNGDNTITHTSGSGATFTFTKAPTHTASPAQPATAYVGDTWWDTSGNALWEYINDGTINKWVQISAAAATSLPFDWQVYTASPIGVITTRSDGTALVDGDQCWDRINHKMYYWDVETTAWAEIAVAASGGFAPAFGTGRQIYERTGHNSGATVTYTFPAQPAGTTAGYWVLTLSHTQKMQIMSTTNCEVTVSGNFYIGTETLAGWGMPGATYVLKETNVSGAANVARHYTWIGY